MEELCNFLIDATSVVQSSAKPSNTMSFRLSPVPGMVVWVFYGSSRKRFGSTHPPLHSAQTYVIEKLKQVPELWRFWSHFWEPFGSLLKPFALQNKSLKAHGNTAASSNTA